MQLLLIAMLVLSAAHASGQIRPVIDTTKSGDQAKAAGAKLKHFSQVDEGVYKGSKPRSDADYRFLQSLHVKYIMDLQLLPFTYRYEKERAQKYGITLIVGRMNASPLSPSEKHIDAILAVLKDRHYHPVYFHCALGRDRTSIIATLYKMYFQGMPREEAMRYLHESSYADSWLRSGLTRYIDKHPSPPASLLGTPQAP